MKNVVRVERVEVTPILKLIVSRPQHLADGICVDGQTELSEFHITLARLDDLGVSLDGVELAAPPASLGLCDDVLQVRSAEKCSTYCEVDALGQDVLKAYVKGCEEVAGRALLDPARVFHVTLTNAGGGDPRASVGAVWEYPSTPVGVGSESAKKNAPRNQPEG